MEKLSEMLKGLLDKIKKMSMLKKIAFSVLFLSLIISAIFFANYINQNKYGVLFSNLPAEDAAMVTGKLKEKKIYMQIKGSAIYVPKDQVDELRLELAPNMSNGSKGFELMDTGNKFGMTDEEFKIQKQRATQGELEKTIKSFPQIVNARVHITPAQNSVFVRDSQPGKAAVYIQLKTGNKLSAEQVKSIVALISGSVENIPKENVEVIDDKMNLLSRGLFDQDNNDSVNTSLEKQQNIETEFEKKLENALKGLLEPALGKNKVQVKVNADLDFDSKKQSQITYDPNKVELSTHSIKENTNSPASGITQSPIDNNMNNTTTTINGNSTTTREEQTNNYNVGKTEKTTISAPGEVKRITASVIINGKLDDATKADIQKAVATAIGFKQDRGDEISILGMNFDSTEADEAKKQFEDMQKQTDEAKKMALYRNIAVGAGSIIGLLLLLFILRKSKKKEVPQVQESKLDVIISEHLQPKEKVEYPPLNLEANGESSHIEKEIKKYASDKPDQVAEIIRSWLAEDER